MKFDILQCMQICSMAFECVFSELREFQCIWLFLYCIRDENLDTGNTGQFFGGGGRGAAAPRTPFKIGATCPSLENFQMFLEFLTISDVSKHFWTFGKRSGRWRDSK